ncbi:hypothetical protein K443DRAFT_5625 [Laccaria amethystina LaAM-08-1]|uniref:Uncharacterized protein n=1 Tax=Laccaria amethystina LaAM-08-1 TaxID=1095629 RepID=A0A0C9XZB6_9AGAR|nr:hypothetical protein K443DRAFT_5625 [Laccaria amethystina LaAM-08-1]
MPRTLNPIVGHPGEPPYACPRDSSDLSWQSRITVAYTISTLPAVLTDRDEEIGFTEGSDRYRGSLAIIQEGPETAYLQAFRRPVRINALPPALRISANDSRVETRESDPHLEITVVGYPGISAPSIA